MPHKQKSKKQLYKRVSCLTGKVVWAGLYTTNNNARQRYFVAKKHELRIVDGWDKTASARCTRIKDFLNECLAELPITAELTKQQITAARNLRALANEAVPCPREFYDHIIEETSRREFDNEIRRQMRERKAQES